MVTVSTVTVLHCKCNQGGYSWTSYREKPPIHCMNPDCGTELGTAKSGTAAATRTRSHSQHRDRRAGRRFTAAAESMWMIWIRSQDHRKRGLLALLTNPVNVVVA
jgi:hypothetical protein